MLNLSNLIKDKYAIKILNNEAIFKAAKVDEFGEIFWQDVAEIVDLNGEKIACEYDLSPEFVYHNSEPIKEESNTNIK